MTIPIACAHDAFRELMAREGGSVGAAEAGKLHEPANPHTDSAMIKHAIAGSVIAVKTSTGWLFPVWQFAQHGGLLNGLRDVLYVLRNDHPAWDDLAPVTFFLNLDPELSGLTPLDALRKGEVEKVIQRALSVHE